MGVLRYHPKLKEIINNLNVAKIGLTPTNGRYYDSTEKQQGYNADTIFAGKELKNKDWISVNIIEGYDKLFIHTSLKPCNICNLHPKVRKIKGFRSSKTLLIEVDDLSKGIDVLIDIIQNQILNNF